MSRTFCNLMMLAVLLSLGSSAFASSTATIQVMGAERPGDASSITISFSDNGGRIYSQTLSYGQFSTPASVASAIGAMFSNAYVTGGYLSAQVSCGTNNLVRFALTSPATFGNLTVSGSATSFQLVSSGFTSSSFDRPTPSITWPTPAAISYGTALSSAQLNASASYNGVNVPGTFEYIPTAGEVLDAGSQTLVVTFFPTDSVNYSPTSGSAVLQINPSSSLQPLTIYNFSITSYAPNGNLQNYTDSVTGTWRLSYDSLNRLIAGTPATGNNLCWSYDSFGNRTAQTSQSSACPTLPSVPTATASYNTNNQVAWTTVNGASSGFSYDAAGNVLSDNVNAYIYDGEGRICAVKSEPVAGTYTMTQYIYDAEGTRVAKGFITNWAAGCNTAANGFTPTNSYVLGPSNEQLTETDGNGNWIHSNVYAAGMLIATYDTAPTGNPALHFQLEDWLGSRRMQTDISGNPEEIFTNLPFGDGLARAIASGAPSTADDATEHHFTGKERDQESGNDYFGARYYASSMGRFMSPDPGNIGVEIANPQTWNMYSYGLNNPLTITDPNGMYVCEDSTDCSSKNDQAFAKNLADAQTAANKLTGDDQTKARRAIDAYGAQGVDNGVNVRFDSNVQGGVTEVSGTANGEKGADNPNGQSINVTFNSGNASAGLVAHEGSHVADASAWVASGFSQGMDPTHGQTELNAYHVQFNIVNAQHPVLMDFSGQPFSLGSNKGRASWIQGTTFKMVLPDMLRMIKNNYSDLDKPAFTKGEAVQP